MPETPSVSVIIVSWNAKDYLVKCLRSLNGQAPRYPLEIIVVDNASTDGSPEAVEHEFLAVRVIRTGANLGFAKANNIGIRASSGDYVCLVNSDVEVLPGCITRLVDYCQQHPEVGMVGPRIRGRDGKLQRSCRGFPGLWNMFCRALALDAICPKARFFGGYLLPFWAHDSICQVDILSGCFWLARRQAVDKVGLLDESFFMYGEDMDWCKRFWNGGWPLTFVNDAEAIHYGGASSANAPMRFFIEKQRADFQYWEKHHNWIAQRGFFAISALSHLIRTIAFGGVWLSHLRPQGDVRFKFLRSLKCLVWLFTIEPKTPSARQPIPPK
jgi:hypothetical protein